MHRNPKCTDFLQKNRNSSRDSVARTDSSVCGTITSRGLNSSSSIMDLPYSKCNSRKGSTAFPLRGHICMMPRVKSGIRIPSRLPSRGQMPAATDEQESEPKTAEPIDEWARLEYEEANRYGRTVYETIFRLAQMTFVINPALGAGFYYVFFEKKDKLFSEIGIVGVAVAVLGIVYNLGAYGVYV